MPVKEEIRKKKPSCYACSMSGMCPQDKGGYTCMSGREILPEGGGKGEKWFVTPAVSTQDGPDRDGPVAEEEEDGDGQRRLVQVVVVGGGGGGGRGGGGDGAVQLPCQGKDCKSWQELQKLCRRQV